MRILFEYSQYCESNFCILFDIARIDGFEVILECAVVGAPAVHPSESSYFDRTRLHSDLFASGSLHSRVLLGASLLARLHLVDPLPLDCQEWPDLSSFVEKKRSLKRMGGVGSQDTNGRCDGCAHLSTRCCMYTYC
ncbi:hypothetical protein AVEN_109667-1 [Araneus ventricosus]|uniref:Uncharacterized protein n=1 Tax=Araneus ventricosus TaxID=182803 RepID=A0A4Y2G000_ARAVE|nr:hypothetical protein AVEN_109667-1 [Araneus ventricosus]